MSEIWLILVHTPEFSLGKAREIRFSFMTGRGMGDDKPVMCLVVFCLMPALLNNGFGLESFIYTIAPEGYRA